MRKAAVVYTAAPLLLVNFRDSIRIMSVHLFDKTSEITMLARIFLHSR
ncbi:MAG: hypothetical protein ACI9GH_000232, partial [Candidatus Paceibacteria bacterium]